MNTTPDVRHAIDAHIPNENMRVGDFVKGIMASALVFQRVVDATLQDFVLEEQSWTARPLRSLDSASRHRLRH
jgi:hypothetical protein